jgi:hypothetical protein
VSDFPPLLGLGALVLLVLLLVVLPPPPALASVLLLLPPPPLLLLLPLSCDILPAALLLPKPSKVGGRDISLSLAMMPPSGAEVVVSGASAG